MLNKILLSSTLVALSLLPANAKTRSLHLTPIGAYVSGLGTGAAEIAAYDPAAFRLFVVNATSVSVDALDISDPTNPTKIGGVSLIPFGGVANSVSVHDGIVAIAVEGIAKTDPGKVLIYDRNLNFLSAVTVGAQPDMITFSHNGKWLVTANEGEPNSYSQATSVDPLGTISIIDMSSGPFVTQANVRTLDFTAYNAPGMLPAGIRVFGPNATPAQDLEPEYVTISHNSKTAWVTLQENNAIAEVDLKRGQITRLTPLGGKDHSILGNDLDPSDRDNTAGTGPAIKIGNWPIQGLYMPDAIANYAYKSETFLVTANEGDVRDWPGFLEEIRISDAAYVLDPVKFPSAATLKQNRNLGRLRASKASGDTDGDGDFDEIHVFGARSFTIRRTDGSVVFDSGDDFEQLTAALYPTFFNVSNDNLTFDSRSTSKGPEPEAVVVGNLWGRTYAFIGLERIGGVMVYDVTNPFDVSFMTYANNRTFATPFALPTAGDLGPEGLVYIQHENSPTGQPLLITANEVSGTTTIYQITLE